MTASPAPPAPTASPLPPRQPPQPWRYRWAPLFIWLVLLAVAGLQIARTTFSADLSAFLPANPDPQQRVLVEQLHSGVPARTLLLGIEGGDAAARAAASKTLAAALRSSGHFEQIQNGQTETFAEVGTWLFDNRYLLSPAVDAQRFSAAGLRQGLQETLSLLGTPAGAAVKPIFDRDPTGETLRIGEALIPSSAPRSESGVWVSRAGNRVLLVAVSKAPGADLDAQALAIAHVKTSFAKLQNGAAHATGTAAAAGAASAAVASPLVLHVSGAPVFAVDSRARIEHEVNLLAIAGTVLMSGVLLLAFGSLKALGVALLPVLTGVVGGITAVSVLFGGVHGITLGFGATLIGEAVDYAIYYLIQARAGGWQVWLRSGWPTVRLGLLTSVCGFAALVFSGFPGLAQLGVFSVAGLISAVLFMRCVMPRLMPQGAGQGGLRPALGRFSRRGVVWMARLRWPLLALGVVAAVLLLQRSGLASLPGVQQGGQQGVLQGGQQGRGLWEAELSSLSPVSADALALDASLRADLSAGDARALVVVKGADLQATLQGAESVAVQLDRLTDQGAIGGYDSVTRWLPSLRAQQARQASLPETAALQAELTRALQGLPLKAERLAPFVADVQAARSRAPISMQALRGTTLALLVDALLLQRKDGSWVALMPLQPLLGAPAGKELDLLAVRQALKSGDSAAPQVIEIGAELKRLYARYLGEARDQALLGALGVVLLVAVALRSLPRLLRVCLPLLWAVLLTMGALAALQVQLGILHLVGLLLVVAVGSNYALFFDMLRQRGRVFNDSDNDMLASLLLANLTTVLGFGLIAFSSIPALSAVGRVVAPGSLLALVLSAAFIRQRPGGLPAPAAAAPATSPAPPPAAPA